MIDKLRLTDVQMSDVIDVCDKNVEASNDIIKVVEILDGFGGDIKMQRGLVDRLHAQLSDIEETDGKFAAEEFRPVVEAAEELVEARAEVQEEMFPSPEPVELGTPLDRALDRRGRATRRLIAEKRKAQVSNAFRIVQCIVGEDDLNALVALEQLKGTL